MTLKDGPASPLSFDGRQVVVTGAGGTGIGAAVARLVSGLGGDVTVIDVKDPVDQNGRFVRADLSTPRGIDAALSDVGDRVDHLFNTVGIGGLSGEEHLLAVNFLGVRYLTERVVDGLMPDGGSVVSVSSRSGWNWRAHVGTLAPLVDTATFDEGLRWGAANRGSASAMGGPYAVSKMALVLWSARAAARWGSRGVRVNCTLPGTTETPMWDAVLQTVGEEAVRLTPTALPRNSSPIEQAWPLVFLNSDAASYVTGADLSCDGGSVGGAHAGVFDMGARERWLAENAK